MAFMDRAMPDIQYGEQQFFESDIRTEVEGCDYTYEAQEGQDVQSDLDSVYLDENAADQFLYWLDEHDFSKYYPETAHTQ